MNASTRRLSNSRIVAIVIDYAYDLKMDNYIDANWKDPIIARSNLSDEENHERIRQAYPWAQVIQKENLLYGAYEDPVDADKEMMRLEKGGIIKRTKRAACAMLKRVRIKPRLPL